MIGKTLSHFKIVERIGEGGMGVVYKAEDTELQRVVALKVLQPEHVGDDERHARFVREAQTAAKVTHPNIATIYEVGDVDGIIFIAMELVAGQALREKLREGAMAAAETIDLAIQVADGMASAHRAGVIHRDLKPDNIMVDEDGRAKILDFGLAKAFDSGDEPSGDDLTLTNMLTREGRILGTAAYMSPEQARGKPLDARSDIFSLGIILYEMVTGRRPFEGETTTDILASILREEPTSPLQINPQIPPEMGRIIAKCLEKKPAERYQDSRDLVVDLRRMLKDPTTQSFISDPSLLSDPSRLASFPSADPLSSGNIPPGPPTDPSGSIISGAAPTQQWTRSGEATAVGPSSGKSATRLFVGAALLAAVAALIVFVLGPGGRRDPVPTNNRLAVMLFQNLKDPADSDRLGQILQELVITELSDIDGLSVYSAQRLYDVHKQVSGSDKPIYDPEVATEVAIKAGAGSMIQGRLSQLGETWILTAQLVDVATGTVQGSQRIDGTDLYAMVEELGHTLRDDLRETIETFAPQTPPSPPSAPGLVARSVREKTTSSLDAYRTYLVGNDLLEQQEFHMAADTLQKAVDLDPTFGQAYYKLAMALWWPGDNYDAAGEVLEDMLTRKIYATRKERLLAEAALELIRNDDKSRAIALYAQITAQFPDDKDAWYGYGEALFHNFPRMEERALDAFRNAVRLDPGFGLAYRHILDIQWENNQFAESIAEIQPLLTALPQSPLAHEYWIGAASRWGQPKEVEKALTAARGLEADETHQQRVLIQAAEGNLNRGDYQMATQLLTEARSIDPDGIEVNWYQGMGQALWRLDRIDELHELLESAKADFPENSETFREGELVVALAEGDMSLVFKLSEAILEESPGSVQPRVFMSTCAAMKGEWPTVDGLVQETLESDLDVGSKRAYLRELSTSLSDLEHYDRARLYLDRAVEISEEEPGDRTKNSLAWLDARTGRLDEAQLYYEGLNSKRGGSSGGNYGLMYIALRRQDYVEAGRLGQLILETGPVTGNLMRYMAIAMNGQQQFHEALPYAERAATMDPGYSSQSILAWTLVAGDIDVARSRQIAHEIVGGSLRTEESRWNFSEFPSPEHSIGLGLLKSGKVEEAIEVLEDALMKRPDRTAIAADLRRAREAL